MAMIKSENNNLVFILGHILSRKVMPHRKASVVPMAISNTNYRK
jgi:hypothetical protein